jgi:hypothetical protein
MLPGKHLLQVQGDAVLLEDRGGAVEVLQCGCAVVAQLSEVRQAL